MQLSLMNAVTVTPLLGTQQEDVELTESGQEAPLSAKVCKHLVLLAYGLDRGTLHLITNYLIQWMVNNQMLPVSPTLYDYHNVIMKI